MKARDEELRRMFDRVMAAKERARAKRLELEEQGRSSFCLEFCLEKPFEFWLEKPLEFWLEIPYTTKS